MRDENVKEKGRDKETYILNPNKLIEKRLGYVIREGQIDECVRKGKGKYLATNRYHSRTLGLLVLKAK